MSIRVLAALAVLAACTAQSPPDPPGGPLSLVPADANVIVRVDIDRLHATPLWSGLVEERLSDPRVDRVLSTLAREGGWNPLSQWDSITCATRWPDKNQPFICILQGEFNEERLLDWLGHRSESLGIYTPTMIADTYRRTRIYRNGIGRQGLAVAFFGDSIVAAGTAEWIRKAIDRLQEDRSVPTADRGFSAALRPPSDFSVAWIAAQFDDAERNAFPGVAPGTMIHSATGYVALANGLTAQFRAVGESERDGTAIQASIAHLFDQIRQDSGFGPLGISSVFDHILVSRRGNEVDASLQLDSSEVSDIKTRLAREAGAMP